MDKNIEQIETDLDRITSDIEDLTQSDENQKEVNAAQRSEYNDVGDVFFAFIDVLGFSKIFSSNMKRPESKEAIASNYSRVFNYYFDLMNASHLIRGTMKRGNKTCAGQTSDSLYFYTDRSDVIMEFIKVYSHFSLYAMSQNIFFRGGISVGCLFTKEPYQFFGDSVIRAYSLESGISKYPIIIIDQKACDKLKMEAEFTKLTEETDDCRIMLKPFVNWDNSIKFIKDEDFTLEKIDKDAIRHHIEENKSKFEYDEKNYGKYLFLRGLLPA